MNFIKLQAVFRVWESRMTHDPPKCHLCHLSGCSITEIHQPEKINTCGVPYSKHHFRWRKHVRSWSHLARYNYVLYIKNWLVFHGFGAGHLRESRLLLFFASYYENNIVWGGGVGWGAGGWGVGWGGIIMSFALPHICDATYLYAPLHFIHIHTYVMLRFCNFFCPSTL